MVTDSTDDSYHRRIRSHAFANYNTSKRVSGSEIDGQFSSDAGKKNNISSIGNSINRQSIKGNDSLPQDISLVKSGK